jgi:hypothetical protein
VVVTVVAATLGLVVTDVPILRMDDVSFRGDNALAPLTYFACGLALIIAPLVGVGQGLIIKRLFAGPKWQVWIIVTFLGVIIVEVLIPILGILSNGNLGNVFTPIVLGAMLGLPQAVALRGIHRAGWWPVISSTAWLLGAFAGVAVEAMFFPEPTEGWLFYPLQAAIEWGISWAAATAVYAMVTGAALIWLARLATIARPVNARSN